MKQPSRLEATRRKLRLARYVVVAGSAAAFGSFALVARAGHAGKRTTSAASASTVSQSSAYASGDDTQSSSYSDGQSSLAPSDNSTPLVQSTGS